MTLGRNSGRKKGGVFLMLLLGFLSLFGQSANALVEGPWSNLQATPEQRAAALLANMTQDEKLLMLHGPRYGRLWRTPILSQLNNSNLMSCCINSTCFVLRSLLSMYQFELMCIRGKYRSH